MTIELRAEMKVRGVPQIPRTIKYDCDLMCSKCSKEQNEECQQKIVDAFFIGLAAAGIRLDEK